MSRSINALAGSRWMLLLYFVTLVLTASSARGQRPALIENSDEPGRVPYEAEIEFYSGGCQSNCANFGLLGSVAVMDINSPVPAGKRLIIRHISGQLYATQACGLCSVGLQSTPILSAEAMKWSFLGPFFGASISAGTISNGFSSDAFVTVEPGAVPHLRVVMPGWTTFISYVVVSGYLIDATAS